jgi:membrane protein DedA with SNARE-associated domain
MQPMLRWSALGLLVLALILVPFALWEEPMAALSRELLRPAAGRAALIAIVVLLLSGDVLLPIPSSFVSAGAVALLGGWQGALSIVLGMTIAAWLGYGLGLWGGEPLARRMVGAVELERARSLMQRYDTAVLLICRGVPVLAEASTLLAGVTRLSVARFALVTGLGNLGLAAAYALIGVLELTGAWAWLMPFVFGIAVPALALLGVRLLSGGSR